MIGAALDQALDRTVVGGYTSIGYRLRERAWDDRDLERLDGRVAVVTGATSGLGAAAAAGLAGLGAAVWLVARNEEKAQRTRDELERRVPGAELRVGICDLSSLRAVRALAARLGSEAPRIDVLVNNAGVLPPERSLSDDGIELTLATNVVGPFLLTNLLVPALRESAPSRVINVSSGGMYTQRVPLEDLQFERRDFDGTTAYARTKRMQVMLTAEWARRLRGSGIAVHAMHPGWADTPGLEASLPGFHRLVRPLLRTPEQGADTIVWLAAAPGPGESSGGFWHDRRERPTHLLPWTRDSGADRARLWAECERLARTSTSTRKGAT